MNLYSKNVLTAEGNFEIHILLKGSNDSCKVITGIALTIFQKNSSSWYEDQYFQKLYDVIISRQ